MNTNDMRSRMKEEVTRSIGGMASDIFKTRVYRMIDDLSGSPEEMEPGLNNVRLAIKLHFDDALSEKVYGHLRRMSLEGGGGDSWDHGPSSP